MTDEALFYQRFVEDVRRCAAGRAPAAVAEMERRVQTALVAPAGQRERRWAQVVALVNELLAGLGGNAGDAAGRLRAFARENSDLGRPRDVAITDFRFAQRPQGIMTDSHGRRILVFATLARASLRPSLDEVVAGPARLVAEWAVYALCGGCAAAAFWFAFVAPV